MKKKTYFILIFLLGILVGFLIQFSPDIKPKETSVIPISNTAYATTLIPLLKDAEEIKIIMFTMRYPTLPSRATNVGTISITGGVESISGLGQQQPPTWVAGASGTVLI